MLSKTCTDLRFAHAPATLELTSFHLKGPSWTSEDETKNENDWRAGFDSYYNFKAKNFISYKI